MSMYDLRLFDAANNAPIFNYPPQAQSYGAYAAGDDFFFNNNRFAITKVGHAISGPPAAPLVTTMLMLGHLVAP